MKNYFFTADEHYYHRSILKFQDRPWDSVEKMNEGLIDRHNAKVSRNANNITIHCGDFTFMKDMSEVYRKIINRLNGSHVFLIGSHDYWMRKKKNHFNHIWEKKIDGFYIVACHYAMRVWPRSHYGAWHVFGHSHGHVQPFGKSYDVGVDNNDFEPISFDELAGIMIKLDDNFNLIKRQQ